MDRKWHVLDAQGVPLGRIASEAAKLLLGKHKPTYEPHLAMGDFVVIVNAGQVAFTGDKLQTKVYYRHTGYPGGLRERTLQELLDRDPRRVVEKAVKGMLPHNVRGRELFRHLKVYRGPEHPHQAQLAAGTGARAKKRAEASQAATATSAATTAPATESATSEQTASAQTAE
jgi:large subunit ribosomal protein L13